MSSIDENVLILQGGGSLGAFGCGVFQALAENNIKIDIAAGTSIGGINAAIIAGSKDDRSERALEQFWLELADRNVCTELSNIQYQDLFLSSHTKHDFTKAYVQYIESTFSFYYSALYGNNKMFLPRWTPFNAFSDPLYFRPDTWTYIYDHHRPLSKTLEDYIDYRKLGPNGKPNARLIITAVDVLTARPLTFDSTLQQIKPRHLLATCSYPLYGFPWTEVERGVYAWDGSLLSNTPLREVIDASPKRNKQVFLVENYPKKINVLPRNLPEVIHRARDIIFSDKTLHNVRMSRLITIYLKFIDELYQLIEENSSSMKNIDKNKLQKIRTTYNKLSIEHGAEIRSMFHIVRDEPIPHLYENADFSLSAIKQSIREGKDKTNQMLSYRKD